MIKVSIIVPVYNVEKFLPQCMDSLINQSLHEIEIICVNDGSTDKSLNILNRYAKQDKRIKILSQQNMGLSGARNTGLSFATGEYICFVDSDDWIDIDYCEKLYKKAKKENADIVRGIIYNEYPDRTENHEFNKTIKEFSNKKIPLGINDHCVVAWDGIYKRQFLMDNHINFIFGLVHEDIPFTAKTTFYANKIIPCDNTFYHYRQSRPGQLSEINLKSINGTFFANHYALDFINLVKYKDEKDYIDALHRIIWRYDSKFIQGIKKLDDFSDELKKKYFDMWCNDLKMCKHLNKIKRHFHWLKYVIKGDMKKYIKKRI